jgi:hypothetical protein
MLNTKHGTIIEAMIRCSNVGCCDIRSYFDDLKEGRGTDLDVQSGSSTESTDGPMSSEGTTP